MNAETAVKAYLPMTETMYYILLSLIEPRHGYGIMLHIAAITGGRIKIGAGTIYNSLSKLERDELITMVAETDRRKLYVINEAGMAVLKAEIVRLGELYDNGREYYGEGV